MVSRRRIAEEPFIRAALFEGLEPYLAPRDGELLELSRVAGIVGNADSEAEVSLNEVARIMETIAAKLDEPGFAIRLAQSYPVGGSGAFGYILINAKTVRDAIKAIVRYCAIVVRPIHIDFAEREDGGELRWSYPNTLREYHGQYNLFTATLIILRLRRSLGEGWGPQRVEFQHRDPGLDAAMRNVIGSNVAFSRPLNRIIFRPHVLEQATHQADARLFGVVKQLGDILLEAKGQANDLPSRVRAEILDHLGVIPPTATSISESMRLSPGALARRLSRAGTNFTKLLGEARRDAAERYLRDTDLPLTDIAFMLGFSELSAFTRAATQWFGMPPRAYREHLHGRNAVATGGPPASPKPGQNHKNAG
jgi:AraC-like DNA-binding protein